jgi:histone deacetylase 1/2
MDFKKNVVYYYDDMIGTFNYAIGHPMKPLRVAMTDELVRKYELYPHMDVIVLLILSKDRNVAIRFGKEAS